MEQNIIIKTRYEGTLRTEATHLRSGRTVITDAPLDNNGKGEAFSPTDLVCAALASCKMTIMGILAEREQIDLSGMHCTVEKIMTTQPRRIGEVVIHLYFPQGHTYSEKQRKMLEHAANTCPVAMSLSADTKRTVFYHFD